MVDRKFSSVYANSYALVVGINTYRNANQLLHARSDAMAVSDVLSRTFGFPRENVTLLLDEQATRDGIRNSFSKYVNLIADDRVLFYFSGHGFTKSGNRGDIGFLVPADGTVTNLASLIRWRELLSDADFIPAKHVLFILDACFGGLVFQRSVGDAGQRRFRKDMLERYARQALTAGKGDQTVSDGNGNRRGHSIFTSYLLDAWDSELPASKEIKCASDLSHYVLQMVATDNLSQQTPAYGLLDGEGEFFFDAVDDRDVSSSTVDAIGRAIMRSDAEVKIEPSRDRPAVGLGRKHKE